MAAIIIVTIIVTVIIVIIVTVLYILLGCTSNETISRPTYANIMNYFRSNHLAFGMFNAIFNAFQSSCWI